MLTTDQKGAVAEAAIALEAIKLGIGVARPLGDERYDFIFDLRPRLLRVQCKWATRYGDVIVLRCYRARRTAHGLLRGYYRDTDIDVFGFYCPDIDRAFIVPVGAVPTSGQMQLRLSPARNNQKLGIRWAADFDFAATLRRLGAIAQLGERVAGSDEVAGSSPAGST